MTLDQAVDIAQLVTAIGTLLAILVTVIVAYRTFKEIRIDRKLRVRPFVLFEPGGNSLQITERQFSHRIGGVNPTFVEWALGHLPADMVVLDLDEDAFYGKIVNIGAGPAIEVSVRWVAEKLTLESESFTLDEEKRNEARYAEPLNTMPPVPNVLKSGEQGQLSRIPTFLVMDSGRRITEASGFVVITYKDTEGDGFKTRQDFSIWRYDRDGQRDYGVTFSDVHEASPTLRPASSA